MPNTYTKIYIHAVFAVKGRQSLVSSAWKEELYKYICGIVNGKKQKVYAINGMPDHIHILLSIKPDVSLSDLIKDIKANSSRWINDRNFVKGAFRWQEGFGAFSVSESALDKVIGYIQRQEEHHAKKSFQAEYIEFLERYQIEFDKKYLFEPVNAN